MRSAHTDEKQFVCTFLIKKTENSTNTTNSDKTDPTTDTTDTTDTNTTTTTNTDDMMECGKRFAFKHVLERHMKTHEKQPKVALFLFLSFFFALVFFFCPYSPLFLPTFSSLLTLPSTGKTTKEKEKAK
jgi:hypothetical protein